MKKGYIIFTSLLFLISCGDSSTETKSGEMKSADTSAAVAPAAAATDAEAEKGLALIAQSDCLTCHKLTETLIGPPYAAVAAKYQGKEHIIDTLASKIIKGGAGVWGSTPMSPHPMLSLEDAKTMAHYVMTVKN